MGVFSGNFRLEKVFDTFGLDIPPFDKELPDLDLNLYEQIADKLRFTKNSRRHYLRYCKNAKEIYLDALEDVPAFGYINDFMFALHEKWFKHDKRDQDKVVYRPEVVLMVMLLAQMENKISCCDVANYWLWNNALLQYLVPGMPSPEHLISDETVRSIRCMAPEKDVMAFFQEYFGHIKDDFIDLIQKYADKQDNASKFRPTIGGDGQELRASFRRGETSRKKKGAHGVSFVDCDTSTVIGCTTVTRKNHEVLAFTKILQNISVADDCIFFSDALNTRDSLTLVLDEQNIDYLLPLKDSLKNTPIREQFIAKFENGNTDMLKQEFVSKAHGRIEQTTFSLISADDLSLLLKAFPNIKSVLRYTKSSQRYIKDAQDNGKSSKNVIYLISTLECNEENFEQLIHSVNVRWNYEAHHNTLDVVMLQDYRALCDQNHLAYTVGFNKIIYNVMNYARYRMIDDDDTNPRKAKAKPKPLSFKQAFHDMEGKPAIAMQYLIEYFLSNDSDKTLNKSIQRYS